MPGKVEEIAKYDDASGEWQRARQFADILGRPHTLFTSAIRYLRGLTQNGTSILEASEPYPLCMLLKSSSMRAVLYYAAQALHKDALAKQATIDGFALFRVFPPDELASVLATTYLYRRLKRSLDARVWESLSQEIQIQMETGFYVGSKIPAIGTHRGLLMGVVRYSALGLFSIKDGRGFKLHKRELNEKEKLYLLDAETSRWNCNHLQISSILIQSIGLGVPAANALVASQCPGEQDHPDMHAWWAAKAWIQSLLEDERAPQCYAEGSPYYLAGEPFANLQERVDSIYEMGSSFDWIDKTKEDLPKSVDQKIETSLPDEPAKAEIEENPEIL